MTEKLLEYVWQFQLFAKSELRTEGNENIQILSVGTLNTNQGPDFSNAKIKIGDTVLVGNIELHVCTSDWLKHGHDEDKNYNNVILHVVWHHDRELNNTIPVLSIEGKVPKTLIDRYHDLLYHYQFIPCERNLQQIDKLVWSHWKERLLIERMLRKADIVSSHLKSTEQHWEEVCWWLVARNFGLKVNADAFEEIAKSLPLSILIKERHQYHAVEALLMGQAGLLEGSFHENYPKLLQREYAFLKKKYALKSINTPLYFLRMRPANFPSVRLAQLAMLLFQSSHLFAKCKEASTVEEVAELFEVMPNDYWMYHYRFDELSEPKEKALGKSMKHLLVINAIIPLLFTYGQYYQLEELMQKALGWLTQMAAEKNAITKGFETLKIRHKNAYDSQALLELYNEYCLYKKCLNCSIGHQILKT